MCERAVMLSPVRVFAGGLTIRRERSFAEWSQAEMTIVEGAGAGLLFAARGWQALAMPFLHTYQHCWLCTPPRSGKTVLSVAYALYRAIECGENVQVGAPSQELATAFWFEKFQPAIVANHRLKKQIAFDETLTTLKTLYRFRSGGSIRVVYNPKQIRSYDAAALVATEAATFTETATEADTLTLMQKRLDDWPGQGHQLFESTQRDDLTRFAREITAGTDSRLHCRCRCLKWFEAGARTTFLWMENDQPIEPVIVCPHCGRRWREKERARLLKHTKIVHTHPNAPTFTLTVNWLHTKRTFAELAALEKRYKDLGEVMVLRDILQNYYSAPTAKSEELKYLASAVLVSREGLLQHRAPQLRKNILPAGAIFCTGAIDVQRDWLYIVLLAVDAAGSLYLVKYETVKILEREQQGQGLIASPERVIAALTEAHTRLGAYNPAHIWVDVSYKSAASQAPIITQWAATQPNVYKIRGRTERQIETMKLKAALPPGMANLVRPQRQPDGTIDVFLNTTQLKNQLSAMMLRAPTAKETFYLPGDMDVTAAGDNALLLHLTSEEPLAKRDGTIDWQKRFGHTGRNDWWDCCVYAYAGILFEKALHPPVPPVAPANPAGGRVAGGLRIVHNARATGFF